MLSVYAVHAAAAFVAAKNANKKCLTFVRHFFYSLIVLTISKVRKLALSFDEAKELPHFEITSFRVNKKIFLSMDVKNKRACLMLSPLEQSVFCKFDLSEIYPVPNKWGASGATYVELDHVPEPLFRDALTVAYCKAAPRKLSEKYERK